MGKTPPKEPKPEEIETEPDAWERFEKAIGKIVPPKPRTAKRPKPKPAKASKDRLTELPRHAVPSVLADTAVLEKTPGNLGQAKGTGKLPEGEKSSV